MKNETGLLSIEGKRREDMPIDLYFFYFFFFGRLISARANTLSTGKT